MAIIEPARGLGIGYPRIASFITLSYPGTPLVYGSWQEVDAALDHDACGFYIFNDFSNDSGSFIQIGIGAASSEQIILPMHWIRNAVDYPLSYYPLRVPKGERLAVRWASGASKTGYVRVWPVYGRGGYQFSEVFDEVSGSGSSGQSAWVSMGTTTKAARAFSLINGSFKDEYMYFELGVDDGAAKHVIGGMHVDDLATKRIHNVPVTHLPKRIPAGEEIFVRWYNGASGDTPRARLTLFS